MDASPPEPERVRVAVRVRPRNEREGRLDDSDKRLNILDVDDSKGLIIACKKKNDSEIDRELRCTYDRVFAPSASQEDVFAYVQDSVQQVAQGYNCTIFAYGQTGTGKTHTMLGREIEKSLEQTSKWASRDEISRSNWGVIPRAIESLFEELRGISQHGSAGVVHCSYMQIYNNDVFDLLQDNHQRMKEPLAVREMIKGNAKHIYVSGLSEFRVTNLDETLKLLTMGNRNRTIRATEYNERSSRSHALLQLSAEVESRGVEGPTTIIRRAKLNLVDLAGSEKWDTDVAMGAARCKELTSINQSLSALGNVISALTDPKRSHIPYRDSKLTRLLQDSLGGNTRTVVIATISADESALEETISTLQFADRAKCVTLRVQVNELVDDAILLARAQREIARLRLLLKKNVLPDELAATDERVLRLTRENAVLTTENKRLRQTVSSLRRAAAVPTAASSVIPALASTTVVSPASGNGSTTPETNGKPGRFASAITPNKLRTARITTPPNPHSCCDLQRELSPSVSTPSEKVRAFPETAPPKREDLNYRSNRVAEPTVSTQLDVVIARNHLKTEVQEEEERLRQIQAERRELERELARLEATHRNDAASPHVVQQSSSALEVCSDDDEVCPICHRIIDHHSDRELDVCIDKEMAMAHNETSLSHSITPEYEDSVQPVNESGIRKEPANARPPSRTSISSRRRGSTPVEIAVANSNNSHSNGTKPEGATNEKPSPYSQDLFQNSSFFLQTRSSALPSRPCSARSSGHSTEKRPSTSTSTSTQRTENPPGNNADFNDSGQSHRNNTNPVNDTNSALQPATMNDREHSRAPIVRHGSKSVKALKKFHAQSPYNVKPGRSGSDKRVSSPSTPSTLSPPDHANNNTTDHDTYAKNTQDGISQPPRDRITRSMRDIGLLLTVYKFRYDCWYPCTIVGYDGKRRLHCCQYENGDKQWHELSAQKTQVLGRTGQDD